MLAKDAKPFTKTLESRRLVTVPPEISVEEALQKMRQTRIHHLVVMKENHFLGVISSNDLVNEVDAAHWPGTSHWVTVGELMRVGVPVLDEHTDIKTALSLMLEKGLTAIPYQIEGKISGILTETDLLHLMDKLLIPYDRKETFIERSETLAAQPVIQRVLKMLADAGI